MWSYQLPFGEPEDLRIKLKEMEQEWESRNKKELTDLTKIS